MADEQKDVKDSSSESQKETSKEGADKRGVSWENVAKEQLRKNEQLAEKVAQMEQYLKERHQPTSQETDEEVRMRVLQMFTQDPKNFVQTLVKEQLNVEKTSKALDWVKSQEGYQPEDDVALAAIIRENGLGGSPDRKVETAWKLFKLANPDRFQPKKVDQADNRDKEVNRYRVAGPGRMASGSSSDERKKLLKSMLSAPSVSEQTEILSKFS